MSKSSALVQKLASLANSTKPYRGGGSPPILTTGVKSLTLHFWILKEIKYWLAKTITTLMAIPLSMLRHPVTALAAFKRHLASDKPWTSFYNEFILKRYLALRKRAMGGMPVKSGDKNYWVIGREASYSIPTSRQQRCAHCKVVGDSKPIAKCWNCGWNLYGFNQGLKSGKAFAIMYKYGTIEKTEVEARRIRNAHTGMGAIDLLQPTRHWDKSNKKWYTNPDYVKYYGDPFKNASGEFG